MFKRTYGMAGLGSPPMKKKYTPHAMASRGWRDTHRGKFLGDTTTFQPPAQLAPGRYEIGITVKGVTGDSSDSPPDLMPFIWNWDKGPFGSGKANIENELLAQGIVAKAVTVKDYKWSNPHRSGYLDFFQLSPNLWDFSFVLVVDILGPTGGGTGLSGSSGSGDSVRSAAIPQVAHGLGVAMLVWVGGTVLVLGITHAIVKSLGGGDAVVTFIKKVAEVPVAVAKALAGGAGETLNAAGKALISPGMLVLAGVAVVAGVIYFKASPRGRAIKSAVWG